MDDGSTGSRDKKTREIGLRSEQITVALVELLDRLAEESHVPFDRAKARRSLDEAMEASPGPAESMASDWTAMAARSIGLRVSLNRTSLAEAASIVQPSDPIAIIKPQSERPLLILLAQSGGKLKVWDGAVDWISIDQLARDLGLASKDEEIDKLLVEPNEPYPTETARAHDSVAPSHYQQDAHGDEHHHEHVSPLIRLWGMMRTESTDLWVVSMFALVVGLFSLATPIAGRFVVDVVCVLVRVERDASCSGFRARNPSASYFRSRGRRSVLSLASGEDIGV